MGFDNECILNIQTLPGEYFCPVCRTLVYPHEALQTQCTHLYCKPCLAYVVATTRACPYDGYLVTETDAKPLTESNKSIAEAIGKIQVHCLYHRSGCQWQGFLSECISHCTTCTFGNSPVVCNRCGTQIIHRQVQEHAQICPGVQPQQHQQIGTTQPPAMAEQNNVAAQVAASQTTQLPSAQTNVAPAAFLSSAPANAATSVPASVSSTLPAATTAVPGQVMPIAQPQAAAQAPTAEQWYQQQQQQQLQYQQYYQQQYPGYDPYQQHAQYQQQAYAQYPQTQMQSFPQTTQTAQTGQPPAYAQPQSQALPQPQQLQQTQPQQMQPQQPLPQSQLLAQPQAQPHPYGHTPQIQVPINPQQTAASSQLPQPQMQSQANQPSLLQAVAQQTGHLQPQVHHPTQPLQGQTPVHPQQQQIMTQQHPASQLPQPPMHSQPQAQAQAQAQVMPRPQVQQYPQMQSQQHLHLQPQSQGAQQVHHHTQQPAAHAVTGHLSYPQHQQSQQMLPGPPQQRPSYMQQPAPQGLPHQLAQHPLQLHSQPSPHQPQMRATQPHMGIQVQHGALQQSQIGHHQNQLPVQQQIQQHPGMQPPQNQGPPSQSGRPQMHPQQGFPSQTAATAHASHIQDTPHMQQYPPTSSQVQQNAPASQGMLMPQGQGVAASGNHGVPGGSPARRLGRPDQIESNFDGGSEAKGTGASGSVSINRAELSGPPTQKQDSDTKHDKGENGIRESLTDNKTTEPSTNQSLKEEHAGKSSERSGPSSMEHPEGIENKSDQASQSAAEEDGRIEREPNMGKAGGEPDNSKLPPHTSAGTTIIAQSHSRGPEIAGQMPIQQGGLSLPSKQDTTIAFPYPGSGKGDKRPPAGMPQEKYPNHMAPNVPLDMQQRPSGPEQLPQNIMQVGPDNNRRFQDLHPYPVVAPGIAQIRSAAPVLAEQMPPPGAFPSQQHVGGFIDPGLQRVPPQMPPQGQLPSSHVGGLKMHPGPLPGPPLGGQPPGSIDLRETMIIRGPPSFQDSQVSMPRAPYPIQDDKFSTKIPGSFDGRQFDLRPPPVEYGSIGQYSGTPPIMAKPNGIPGKLPDLPSHKPIPDRFQCLPDERFKSLPDEGFKPLSDDRFRPFPDPVRRVREFEEDLKQFPRHPLPDSEGISKFDNYPRSVERGPHSWGHDSSSRSFDKTMRQFGLDGMANLDAHMGSVVSRASDGIFGDRHMRDDVPIRSDFKQFDNPPFGMAGRDISDISSNRFESLNNQSRFREFGGRDQVSFGERSRPFGFPSEPFGSATHGSRLPPPSASFDALESSRMIEQFGSGNPKSSDPDGSDFVAGKHRPGETFGSQMPGLGSGSPRGFQSHTRMDEHSKFGFLPPHLRNRDSNFGGNFPPHGFSMESGPFKSDDLYSSDPSQKRMPGSSGWCRICKIDCETVEGLELHSQTREHQKVAMDIVLSIKKNSSRKHKSLSEENISFGDMNKIRRAGFEARGNRL